MSSPKGAQEQALAVLKHNCGFDTPELWVPYAVQQRFSPVSGTPVECCPDCGGETERVVGQYVHYSTLIRLRSCRNCHLIWSDVHIDPAVLNAHWERTYKDQEYFYYGRSLIFEDILDSIDEHVPVGGRVLDFGGAKGHLLGTLRLRRPDLHLKLFDISTEAATFAREVFALDAEAGDLDALAKLQGPFDAIVMSDVLYCEPDLPKLWSIIDRIAGPECKLLIRIPNRHRLIQWRQRVLRTFQSGRAKKLQSHVAHFNPEHIHIFGRNYMQKRLGELGFDRVVFRPTPPLIGRSWMRGIVSRIYIRFAKLLNRLTGGAVIATTSQIVEAWRNPAKVKRPAPVTDVAREPVSDTANESSEPSPVGSSS